MSHTTTCDRDGRREAHGASAPPATSTTPGGRSAAVPSVLHPATPTLAARAGRVVGFLALPEVRWAALSMALFVVAVVGQVTGGQRALVYAVFAGCYLTGGWEPARVGCRRCGSGPWTWICS